MLVQNCKRKLQKHQTSIPHQSTPLKSKKGLIENYAIAVIMVRLGKYGRYGWETKTLVSSGFQAKK